jgi:hypothetical protein
VKNRVSDPPRDRPQSKKPGFCDNLSILTPDFGKKPGFWLPRDRPKSKKSGFWDNFSILTPDVVRNPVSDSRAGISRSIEFFDILGNTVLYIKTKVDYESDRNYRKN